MKIILCIKKRIQTGQIKRSSFRFTLVHQGPFTSEPKTQLFGYMNKNISVWILFTLWVHMSSNVLSSECVEALQPALSEEAMCLVGWRLLVTSSWCTEVWQHGPVVLPLCCLFSILLVVIPKDKFDKTRLMFMLWLVLISWGQMICTHIRRDLEIKGVVVFTH